MLPLPLAPLLTPMPGCWARLISIVGCEGCEVDPLAPPDTPAPVDARGGSTDPAPPPEAAGGGAGGGGAPAPPAVLPAGPPPPPEAAAGPRRTRRLGVGH